MSFDETPIDRKLFDDLVSSGSTQVLSAGSWLSHITEMPGVLQVWGWRNTTTEAAVRVIRAGNPGGKAFKQDEWVLVEHRDGSVTMMGPIKDVDGGHHTNSLPGWPVRRSDSAQS